MMTHFSVSKQRKKALPDGYIDEVLANSKIEGDEAYIDSEILNPIREKFGRTGLGDVIHKIAKPIAKVTGLENCGGCAKRRANLNGI